ncbi:tetratricopeptide repeat protein [Glaciecola sp. 2405UD65-10]|uniref:tetratricopeptide repeat protein n=1 Tax=Glaciecola sp. 2405UD65-10 TaxID=3397244 RepID=UPI003B59D2CE
MNRMTKINKILVATSMLAMTSYSSLAFSQQSSPIVCPGYEKPKTKLLGERAGKKLQAAYEVYLNEELEEKSRVAQAMTMLRDIDAKEPFDKSTVERFLGQLLVAEEGKQDEALSLLESAASRNELNDKDQADILKLVGDLSLQEEKYEKAVVWYKKWMEFTCKEDGDTWTKIAKVYTETKEYDKVLDAADKAISLYEEPSKNPYNLKINAYHETKNYKGAVSTGEILVELFPEEKEYWSRLGFFYMLVEDYSSALATFELAYRQGFLSKKSEFRSMAQLYAAQDIPWKSAELTRKYMEEGLLDTDADDLAGLAGVYRQAREFKEAAKYYGQAAQKEPSEEYYEKQGVMLLDAEDYKGAIRALKNSLENRSEEQGSVHYALMQAYFYDGDFRQANVHAREAMKDPSLRRSANAWLPYIKGKADNRGIKI